MSYIVSFTTYEKGSRGEGRVDPFGALTIILQALTTLNIQLIYYLFPILYFDPCPLLWDIY